MTLTMDDNETLLGDTRVLDLSDEKGVYCAKLLADLGADVLRIEPPGGHPMRHLGPFYHDEPDPEKSLYWFHFNTSKRGITLNLENADGRRLFERLAKTADVVVETFPPGYLDRIGLGYGVLAKLNPELILTSITPFGQTGPHKDFEGSDLIAQAMGGLMRLAGFPEDPPHMLGASQAYHSGSIQAAVGTMLSLYAREMTGKGQKVDVSLQESVLLAMETAMQHYDMRKEIRNRAARHEAIIPGIGLYPCLDGHIFSYVLTGFGAGLDVLVEWMDSEDTASDLREPESDEGGEAMTDMQRLAAIADDPEAQQARLELLGKINTRLKAFLAGKTKQQIFDEASERRLMMTPVQDAGDLTESIQLEALGFFKDVDHPELGKSPKYPGPPCYHISDTPWRISRRAPLLGEHNLEVYGEELGISKEELITLKNQGAI